MIQRVIVACILVCLVSPLAAQTNSTTETDGAGGGRVVAPESIDDKDGVSAGVPTERPERVESNELSPELKQRLRDFQTARDRFLAQQERLRKEALGATDAEREKVRRQLVQLRGEWMRRLREMRREFEERADELKEKLPSHRELLEDLANDTQNSALEQLRQEKLEEQRQVLERPRDGID